jgi:hypothetical protein
MTDQLLDACLRLSSKADAWAMRKASLEAGCTEVHPPVMSRWRRGRTIDTERKSYRRSTLPGSVVNSET